jgi:hypothetical protein
MSFHGSQCEGASEYILLLQMIISSLICLLTASTPFVSISDESFFHLHFYLLQQIRNDECFHEVVREIRRMEVREPNKGAKKKKPFCIVL